MHRRYYKSFNKPSSYSFAGDHSSSNSITTNHQNTRFLHSDHFHFLQKGAKTAARKRPSDGEIQHKISRLETHTVANFEFIRVDFFWRGKNDERRRVWRESEIEMKTDFFLIKTCALTIFPGSYPVYRSVPK